MSTLKDKSDSQNTVGKVITPAAHILFRKKQIDIAELYKNSKPSEVTDIFWIYAKKGNMEYPIPNKKSGKWLLFVNIKFLDETWSVIKKATEEGKLGDFSKTATLKPSPNATRENTKVICVYTNDYDDIDEIMRVRNELKILGFVSKISYKTDKATRDGKYGIQGNKNISLYHM